MARCRLCGQAWARPRDTDTTWDMVATPNPISKGPSVIAAQYTSMRWTSGRGLGMPQMALKARSSVNTRVRAETNNTAMPANPNRLALLVNWVM